MGDRQKLFTPSILLRSAFYVIIIPFLPLLISWHWSWWEAWAYAAILILGFIVSRLLVARRHPDLLAERAKFTHHEDAEPWDKVLAPLVGLGGGLIPLVAGLEMLILGPGSFHLRIRFLALVVFVAGYALGTWALAENRFFSGMVRIQSDRSHQVVSSGPYRFIRHPGYVGGMLSYLAAPFFLDSPWSFIPAIFLAVVLVIRTRKEDQTLQARLQGYLDYAKQVRWRLIPGIW